jgi:hypothetical protein
MSAEKAETTHNRSPKCDKTEVLRRVIAIKTGILEGKTKAELIDYYAEKWGVKPRTVSDYVTKATTAISKGIDDISDELFDWHVGARMSLYNKAIADKDYSTALRILSDMAKIQGVY